MVSLISFDVKQQKTKLYCCDKILKQKKQGTCPSFKSYKKVANCGLRFTGIEVKAIETEKVSLGNMQNLWTFCEDICCRSQVFYF